MISPARILIGDECRNKETGVRSTCLNIDNGLYYGMLEDRVLTIVKIEKIEKT